MQYIEIVISFLALLSFYFIFFIISMLWSPEITPNVPLFSPWTQHSSENILQIILCIYLFSIYCNTRITI